MMWPRAVALIAVFAGACGAPRRLDVDDPRAPPLVAPSFSATRWVPPHPTYLITSRTVSGALLAVAGLIDAVGVLGGVGTLDLGAELNGVLHVNPFKPDGLAQLGIDLQGGFAVFSDDLDPTLVAHLAAPEQTLAFFDRLRDSGLTTQSVIVAKTEIYTTKLGGNTRLSWAVADDWLWIHLAFGAHDGASWFGSGSTVAPGWAANWHWAEANGANGLVGFADLKALGSRLDRQIPAALACAKLLAPIERIGLAAEAGNGKASGRITLDLGSAAAKLASTLVAPPAGWSEVAQKSAIGVQWNLDLAAVIPWFAACGKTVGMTVEADAVAQLGVRAGRGFVQALDLDAKTGRGALAIDGGAKLIAEKLDQIPMRATLESDRTFGPYRGHSLSIPFGPTVDYVVTDKLSLVAVGDGMMAAITGAGKPITPPLASVDITPPRLTVETWRTLLQLAGLQAVDRIVGHLMMWQEGHLALTLAGSELVLEGHGVRAGNRR